MKFSFLNPKPSADTPDMVVTAWPPLGMLYCAEVLMKEGIEVSILDQAASNLSLEQTMNWVKREDPDILGISVLNSSAEEAPKIAEKIKDENPDIKIAFGNYHATFNAQRILKKYPNVDLVVRGEGEYTSLELIRCLEKEGTYKEIKGISFRENGKIVSTPDRPLIEDIDSLPFPNRNLIKANYSSTIFGAKVASRKFSTIISSRGCPFQCKFCGCRKLSRGRWRPRSVDNILKELQLLQSQGYEQFLFVDDNFTLNQKRVTQLCRRIRKEKMNIEWFCDSRVDNCQYDVFKEMMKAGCKIIYFGIENANQRILDYYRKGITPNQSKAAVLKARKAGIDVIVASFIFGATDETKKEIENTLQFVKKLDIDVPQLNILGAFRGTDLWTDLVTKGYVDEDKYWETGVYVPNVSPLAVPFDEIRSSIFDCFQSFYLRPKVLLTELFRTMKSTYRLEVLLTNLSRINSIIKNVSQGVKLE